jgi:uncharacterized cupin superfamily protein
MQDDAEVFWASLSGPAGLERAHLNLVHVPPGKAAFPVHSHAVQEEFVFILSGTGTARIGEKDYAVGPGDYLGYPTDGTPHDLRNTGEEDLVCLMGGERTKTEVATFPELGKVAFQHEGGMTFHDIAEGETRKMAEWVVSD